MVLFPSYTYCFSHYSFQKRKASTPHLYILKILKCQICMFSKVFNKGTSVALSLAVGHLISRTSSWMTYKLYQVYPWVMVNFPSSSVLFSFICSSFFHKFYITFLTGVISSSTPHSSRLEFHAPLPLDMHLTRGFERRSML